MNINEYQSPFQDRYADKELLSIWSPKTTRSLWREIWIYILRSQAEQVPELGFLQNELKGFFFPEYTQKDWEIAQELEGQYQHDLYAELVATRRLCPPAWSHLLHLACTSSDIVDQATDMQVAQSSRHLYKLLGTLLELLIAQSLHYHKSVMPGMTHLRMAEPTTYGYRLITYTSELFTQYVGIEGAIDGYEKRAAAKGAVGTGANSHLLGHNPFKLDGNPRRQSHDRFKELDLMNRWSVVASIIHKLATDARVLFSHNLLTLDTNNQYVGSSAMPGKINPIGYEKVSGLTQTFPGLVSGLWFSAATSLLERTLNDSSSRRVLLPQLFMVLAEAITTCTASLQMTRLNEDRATTLVLQQWASWLPSRIQTQAAFIGNPLSRGQIDTYIEASNGDWSSFVSLAFPGGPRNKHLLDWLHLDYAIDRTKDHAASMQRWMTRWGL